MRSVVGLTLCGILLVGCSSTSSTPAPQTATPTSDGSHGTNVPAAVSGTRLRATYISSADGARQFTGWFDSQRKELCRFEMAEDQTLRCLPAGERANISGFSDPACTKPLVATSAAVTASCKPPGSVTTVYQDVYTNDQCGQVGGRKIFSATKVEGTVYGGGGGGGNCSPIAPPAGVLYYALGAPVPATEFVQGTESIDTGLGLAAKNIVATDGAREHIGWRLGSGAACAFEVMADGETRCVPSGASGIELFTDVSCGTPAGAVATPNYSYGGPCAMTMPNIWLRRDNTTQCGSVSAVYPLESAFSTPASTYARDDYNNSRCQFRGGGSGSGYETRHLGTELTYSLPRTSRVSTGTGRLVAALIATTPNSHTLEPGWYDTVRRTDCAFALASDGKQRCLPVGPRATIIWKDTACKGTERVAGLSAQACGVEAPTYALESSPPATCPATSRVFKLGGRLDLGMASTRTLTGQCARIAAAKTVFDVTEVDPTEFVEGVATTE